MTGSSSWRVDASELFGRYDDTRAGYVAAKLCDTDMLSDGLRPVDELTAKVGADAVSFRRVLRYPTMIFLGEREGVFSSSPISAIEADGVPRSLRDTVLAP